MLWQFGRRGKRQPQGTHGEKPQRKTGELPQKNARIAKGKLKKGKILTAGWADGFGVGPFCWTFFAVG
jgi:hypothetical protein